MRRFLLAAALFWLAGCVEPTTMPMDPAFPDPMMPLPPATGAPLGPTLPTTPGMELSELPDPAVASCMAEVARVAQNNLVSPISITDGPLGQTVAVGVGPERTPWQCQVDRGGQVTEVAALNGA